jgi:hypothetical protein
LAITDPDIYEMDEYRGIDVFVPGTLVEREVNGNRLFRVLLLVGAGFAIVIAITFVLLVFLVAAGLIGIDFISGAIYFAPWSFPSFRCIIGTSLWRRHVDTELHRYIPNQLNSWNP